MPTYHHPTEVEAVNQRRAKIAAKLYNDAEFFAAAALKIVNKDGRHTAFVFNSAQKYVHQQLETQKKSTGRVRALILKGRQQGISTYVQGRFFHQVITRHNRRAMILSHESKSTKNIFGIAKYFYDKLNPALMPKDSVKRPNKVTRDSIDFPFLGSSYMVATARARETGRSQTIHLFHGSEVAFWENQQEHMAGVGQTVPDLPNTEIILETTANGYEMFKEKWDDAVRGKGDFIAIFVPWFWQTEYTRSTEDFEMTSEERDYAELYGVGEAHMAWRRAKLETDFRGDTNLFDQEYPACPELAFRRKGAESFLTPEQVISATKREVEAYGPVIMGVDPAEYGKDDTAITIRQGRKALLHERHHGLGPMEVSGLVAKLADRYRPTHINVDATGIGSGVADRLIELGYRVNRIHFGSKPIDRDLYVIRRDEMWGNMREWFVEDEPQIPDDRALITDLLAPSYSYDSSRRLKLENKESMKKRGVSSPDSADSLALTFAEKVAKIADTGFRGRLRRSWRAA